MEIVFSDVSHTCLVCNVEFTASAHNPPPRGRIGTTPPDASYYHSPPVLWRQGVLCPVCAVAPIADPWPGAGPDESVREQRAKYPGGKYLDLLGTEGHSLLADVTWRAYSTSDYSAFFWHWHDAKRGRIFVARITRGWIHGIKYDDARDFDDAQRKIPGMELELRRTRFRDSDAE